MRSPRRKKRPINKRAASCAGAPPMDKNARFSMRHSCKYMARFLECHSMIDKETLNILAWCLEEDRDELAESLLSNTKTDDRKIFKNELSEASHDHNEYGDVLWRLLSRSSTGFKRKAALKVIELLNRRAGSLTYKGQSDIEKNLKALTKMFSLSEKEKELLLFLYLTSNYDPFEVYFIRHIRCHQITGRRSLLDILKMTSNELNEVLGGKLERLGFFELDRYCFEISQNFRSLLDNPSSQSISKDLFARLSKTNVPLDQHFIEKDELDLCLNLLKEKPRTSSHILLYGPPGTGKTTFAQGIAERLGIKAYAIAKAEDNTTSKRRAAITACINMTKPGEGSLIVVDEADNLLNTKFSWFTRGETQDKGWLNGLLEEPEVRMIWITNKTETIEESVLRRFSYSLHFRPFNKRQRIMMWENVFHNNRVKRFAGKRAISELADNYRVSPGALSLAVVKAKESGTGAGKDFIKTVELYLKAHETLMNKGTRVVSRDKIEENYSLDGLNIEGNISRVMEVAGKFDSFLRSDKDNIVKNLNLLFYGPPGTGKSELARYIGKRLDREILTRRASEIHSMWLGESEKNIKKAFEEAEREGAILVMDEADSFLFSRGRAKYSWEVAITNEFLTAMERFRGILICTSNRMKDLDEASIRRFNQKIAFGYLKAEGNLIFYRKLLLPLIPGGLRPEEEEALKGINNLTPGDFKTVRDRFSFYPEKERMHREMVAALVEEAAVKLHHSGQTSIGF